MNLRVQFSNQTQRSWVCLLLHFLGNRLVSVEQYVQQEDLYMFLEKSAPKVLQAF